MIHPDHLSQSGEMPLNIESEFKTLRKLYERDLKESIYGLPLASLFIVWLAWPLRQNVGAVILMLFIVISILGLSYWSFSKLKKNEHERNVDESDQSYLTRFLDLIRLRKKNLIRLNISLTMLVIFAMNILQRIEISQSVSELLGESGMNILGSTLVFCAIFGMANYVTNRFKFSEFEDGFQRIKTALLA